MSIKQYLLLSRQDSEFYGKKTEYLERNDMTWACASHSNEKERRCKGEHVAQCALLPAVEGHVTSDTKEQVNMILAGVTSKEHAFSLKSMIVMPSLTSTVSGSRSER